MEKVGELRVGEGSCEAVVEARAARSSSGCPKFGEATQVPRATAKPSRDESAKSSHASMRNPDTRNRRNLSLRRRRGVRVDV